MNFIKKSLTILQSLLTILQSLLTILQSLLTWSNILSILLFLVIFILVIAIFLQKNSDDFSDQKNLFGPNVRAETPITITYILIGLLCTLIIALNISKKYDYDAFSLQNIDHEKEEGKKVDKPIDLKKYKKYKK